MNIINPITVSLPSTTISPLLPSPQTLISPLYPTFLNTTLLKIFKSYMHYVDDESFWGNILKAIIVKLPPIDFSIIVGVYLCKELLKLFLHHLLIEKCMLLELLPHPSFQLLALQNVAAVLVVLQEDILNKFLAERIH